VAKGKAIHYLILICLGFVWVFPLLALLVFSFAPNSDIVLNRLFPTTLTLENYARVLTTELRGINIPRSLLNSTIILVIQVVGVLALDAPAAYALARLNFRGRDAIFWIILVTMMMPGHIILISLYEMMSRADLVDTLPGVFLPGLARVIGIFLLRQFFRAIPRELEEAAIVDGASNWQVFSRIMLPLAAPALSTLTIITPL
jgi:multiple sugar transport system permease protein